MWKEGRRTQSSELRLEEMWQICEGVFIWAERERKFGAKIHVLFQLNYSMILWKQLAVFKEMADRQEATGSRRNIKEPGESINGYISLWFIEIGFSYWAPFKIPAQLWALGT